MPFQREFFLLVALVLGFLSRTVSGLSLGITSIPDNKTNLTCFRSSDPAALGAQQLFGSFNDKPLWSRDQNSTGPLPPCSSSSFSPPHSRCEVCHLENVVYMICDNLPDGESVDLNDLSDPLYPKKSDCPRLPPAGSTTAAPVTMATATTGLSGSTTAAPDTMATVTTGRSESTTATPDTMATATTTTPGATGSSRGRTALYISLACLSVIVIVIWFVGKRCKPQKTADNEPNNVSYKPVNGSVQINMNGNGHTGPSAE